MYVGLHLKYNNVIGVQPFLDLQDHANFFPVLLNSNNINTNNSPIAQRRRLQPECLPV